MTIRQITYKTILLTAIFFCSVISFAQDTEQIDSLENLLETDIEDTSKVLILDDLSYYHWNDNPEKANNYAQKELELAQKINFPYGIAKAYCNFGAVCVVKGDYRKAIQHFVNSENIYLKINNQLRLARIYVNLGVAYNNLSVYDTALLYFDKSKNISLALKDSLGLAKNYEHQGFTYYYQMNYKKAIEYYYSASTIYLKINKEEEVSTVYQKIGLIMLSQGKNELAKEFFNKGLIICKKYNNYAFASAIINDIGNVFLNQSQYDSAIFYYNKYNDFQIKQNDSLSLAIGYINLSNVYFEKGEYLKAIDYAEKSLLIEKKYNDEKNFYYSYETIGNIYCGQGNYISALQAYMDGLEISEQIQDTVNIASSYYNISTIHSFQKNYSEAEKYVNKALEVYKKIENINVGACYLSLGNIYSYQLLFEKSFIEYKKAVDFAKKINDKKGLGLALLNIGKTFIQTNQIDSSFNYLNESLPIFTELDTKNELAQNYVALSQCWNIKNNLSNAVSFGVKGYDLARKTNVLETVKDASEILSQIYSKTGNYQKAYEFQIIFKQISDSLQNNENTKKMVSLEMQYEFDKQQKEQELEQAKKDAEQQTKLQKQKMFTVLFIIGFGLMIILAFVILRSYKRKQKDYLIISTQKSEIEEKNTVLEQQKEEITAQNEQLHQKQEEIQSQNEDLKQKNEEISTQKEELQKQAKNIHDSIHYASNIQRAILPSTEIIEQNFNNYFVLFRPSHVVSGDFYWFKQIKNFVFIVAADCTGHGVPGAFMSMLGVSLLNEIVNKRDVNPPNQILNDLRKRIKKSLHQTGHQGEQQDGMDIAFCIIDMETKLMQFSGAYNPMYLIHNNELIEFKADRMPIGVHPKDKNDFTANEIQLQSNDTFYIFSDGYVSQFGGEKDEKFKSKRFQEILLKINNEPLKIQHDILEQTIDNWRGKTSQTDDILVIGVNIN